MYRALEQADDLRACEGLERSVWGLSDLEVLPVSQLVASVHAGGLVVGALEADRLIGFAYGFPAHRYGWADPCGFHSHMLAVLPEHRNRGIGQRLKAFQRDWCLARELHWMTWTFDPLQAGNARLNLEHLGVVVSEYRRDEYGPMGGSLNAGLPTDRLLAYWPLESERVVKVVREGASLPDEDARGPTVLQRDGRGGPRRLEAPEASLAGQRHVRVEIPLQLNVLLREDPSLALEWRLAVREVLEALLGQGWTIVRFVDGAYLLEYTQARAEN